MNILRPALLACFLLSSAHAQERAPERKVVGSVIASAREPAARVVLPKEAVYLGAERFDLYGIADCEIHVFVEADAKKAVQRLYWVQFEGYLPSKPDSTYGYNGATVKIGADDYYVRARFGTAADPIREGSDAAHMLAMVKRAGYAMPTETMNVRLVNLLDATRRRELMIIYIEDLAFAGVKAAALIQDGKPTLQWQEIEKALITRALGRVKVEKTP
ncbi:MAG: hypothetical protein LCH56_05000 [Proteobacteria bacterium]|nr:hypothetical protein [Pseudomonadota bacterium]